MQSQVLVHGRTVVGPAWLLVAQHKERIDRSVSEDVGFDEMNRLVREALVANLYTARAVARKAATFQSVYM